MDLRVNAIRNDKLVGNNTYTSIDECWSDKELIEGLDEDNVKEVKRAILWARDMEEIHLERGLNQRWGEDDDTQLIMWKDWKKAVKENPL
tara:strand:- start:132 stop:401 length:270 start_codon:yes stop_codon:yes gene_type:complete